MEELALHIRKHHLIFLTETRTNDLDRVLQFLPHHVSIGKTVVPDEHNGRKGYGVALLAASNIAESLTLTGISERTQTVWAKCGRNIFGADRDITLCAVYIPPESRGDRSETENQYAHLGDEIHQALTDTPHLIACGDFNAHIGCLDEINDTHFDALAAHPQLIRRRDTRCTQTNRAGKFLIDIASNLDCILTTGRTPGDTGQPTFVGYDKQSKSRPDHVLVSKTLFGRVHHTQIDTPCWLDHCFQSVTFATDTRTSDVDMRLHHDPVCGPEGHFLRWKPHRAADYVAYLEQDTPAKQRLYRAIDNEDVEQTWSSFKSWLFDAALQTGMTTSGTHSHLRPAQQERAAWFDDLCQQKKQAVLDAAMRGEDSHVRDQLLREYKAETQRCKRRYTNSRHNTFLKKLFDKDPTVHKMLKKPTIKHVTPVAESSWHNHLHNVFRQTPVSQPGNNANQTGNMQQRPVRRWTGTVSAMDHLVPLGRRHSNAQPPGPHPFNMPDDNELLTLVANYISGMNTSSSPGFDTITPTFIKCAYKRVPKQQGRGWENINVLAPHIAALFKLLITKTSVPRSWKEAKLTPIHKKGPVTNPGNYRMIAVSGTLYRLYANLLRSMIQDWCIQHNKIPDTQYGFYPGRSTLQPLFILRHLKHAAQKMQTGSSRLYTAFIDFKQAYDSIPRGKLWDHLHNCQMPSHILSILKDLYHADEYTLLDGDKTASVQPSFGVKQGCPLSPLLFAIYLNDIDSVADGVQGALTGTPNFLVTHMLFADDLSLMSNGPDHLQTMLNKLRVYAQRKSLTVNTQKSEVMCFNSNTDNLPPLYFDGTQLPYTDSFKYLGMICDKNINLSTAAEAALRPFTAGTFRVKKFVQENDLAHRLHAHMWLLKTYAIPAGMYASQIWATPCLQQGRDMDNPLQKWLLTVLKRILGVRDTTPSWCVMRECGLEPLQFNWFRAAMRLYNSLTQCNSSTAKKILQADIQLSTQSNDCWSSHVLSAMDGLTQSYIFKQKLQSCEPIDLSRFVVDLRERHLEYWAPFSDTHPREHNSKRLTYHQWCALPTNRAQVTRSPYSLPKYMHLDLPRDVIRSVARFRLRVHTLRHETATWNHTSSPACDICDADDDVQDEQHVLFHCTHPQVVSLRTKYTSLFPPAGPHDVSSFLSQNNNKLFFFLHELLAFYEQASSRTS